MDEARDSGLAEEQEESCDNLGELGVTSSLDRILPLLDAVEILRSCWSRILTYDSTAALMLSDFSPDAARIE